MKKSYEIGDKSYILKSTVHTWFAYKSQFGRELAEDMERAISLDGLRSKEKDSVKAGAYLGEESRIFLQILWAFADEGTPDLEPFEDWLKGIKSVNIADVVKTVSELYAETMKPDRRNRGAGESDDGGTVCTEALADLLLSIGVTLNDMKDLTVGQAINLLRERARSKARAAGKEVTDPDKQYKQLREIVDMIERGEIEDYDREQYEKLKKQLKAWEDG